MKADDKHKVIPTEEKEEEYTNFEYVFELVAAMKEEIDVMQKILKDNNLYATEKVFADTDISDKAFRKLED